MTVGFSNGQKAEKIHLNSFDNLYKVNDVLYRCEQPAKLGMQKLDSMGVVTVLNLRNRISDKRKAQNTSLTLVRLPINTWKMSMAHIVKALQLIETSEKPVAIHCLHGSDRTGAVVAAYRMIYEDWTKEEAILEFRNEIFGYHEKWFPNILSLLNSIDIEALKKELEYNKVD